MRFSNGRTIRHVVWDWNGTLLNDVFACVEALNAILKWRELPPVAEQDYRRAFDFPVQEYYRALGLPCGGDEWRALTRIFHEHYAAASRRAALRDGVPEVLAGLRRRGMPMSVLSASEVTILERMIRERGIRDYFEHVRGLDNLDAHSKWDIGGELFAALEASAAEVLLVGDTTHDFEVAQRLGCDCLLLAGGHQSVERLRPCGCPVAETPAAILEAVKRRGARP